MDPNPPTPAMTKRVAGSQAILNHVSFTWFLILLSSIDMDSLHKELPRSYHAYVPAYPHSTRPMQIRLLLYVPDQFWLSTSGRTRHRL